MNKRQVIKLAKEYFNNENFVLRKENGISSTGMNYGWHLTRFGRTAWYLGKTLDEAYETLSQNIEEFKQQQEDMAY